MECERNELRGILANYTNKDLNNRLNFEIAMLEIEHKQVMSALHKLPMEISDAFDKCKGLIEETEYFRGCYGALIPPNPPHQERGEEGDAEAEHGAAADDKGEK
ncbi:uncharacterized protein LOC143267305 [Peromyscus maniculatus bairdii]|uniref:uncharacterized protein LOC143267305 n=1 Tax=Peromyscus maniculatus bairdii TaxID=230844 RepID=UPI003FD3257B